MTMTKPVHRSPSYPLLSLEWAINTGLSILEKEGLHAMHPDLIAGSLGYKNANNGRSRRILANLKSFGIVEKASSGKLQVSKDIQRYKLSPDEDDKRIMLNEWLKRPLLYRKILEKYSNDLPSDAVLLFELVDEHGFSEDAASKAIKIFRESLNFVNKSTVSSIAEDDGSEDSNEPEVASGIGEQLEEHVSAVVHPSHPINKHSPSPNPPNTPNIRYPVRLTGGRMAFIDVPTPFFENDKKKLIAQLEIIGTEDEDD